MGKLASGLLVTILILSFLIPGIQLGWSGKDGSQPVGASGITYGEAGTSVDLPVSVSAGAQGQSGASSDPDYGVIAKTQVNSSTYNPSKPTNWITSVASNLYFNTTYGSYGWVSQSFDSNRTWGNWVRLTHIDTANPNNYIIGLELMIYDYSTSQWLTPNFIYSTCGNSTPAYWLIDGDTGTSWQHSANELHEVVVGFYSAIQISRVELFVNSYDNRSFWQTAVFHLLRIV
jgi:hypothetical protein